MQMGPSGSGKTTLLGELLPSALEELSAPQLAMHSYCSAGSLHGWSSSTSCITDNSMSSPGHNLCIGILRQLSNMYASWKI